MPARKLNDYREGKCYRHVVRLNMFYTSMLERLCDKYELSKVDLIIEGMIKVYRGDFNQNSYYSFNTSSISKTNVSFVEIPMNQYEENVLTYLMTEYDCRLSSLITLIVEIVDKEGFSTGHLDEINERFK